MCSKLCSAGYQPGQPLSSVFDERPGYRADGIVKWESLLFATDCVAHDTIATGMIEAARRTKGLRTLADVGRPPKYLLTAERIGLGTGKETLIDDRTIE